MELILIIKPLEKQANIASRATSTHKTSAVGRGEPDSLTTPRNDSLDAEFDEDIKGQQSLLKRNQVNGKPAKVRKPDMRHILGFLNQTEWI
jgi:hypothetical protein